MTTDTRRANITVFRYHKKISKLYLFSNTIDLQVRRLTNKKSDQSRMYILKHIDYCIDLLRL